MRRALLLLLGMGTPALLIWAFRTAGPPPRPSVQPPRLAPGTLSADVTRMPAAAPAGRARPPESAAANGVQATEAPALTETASILAAIETASTSYDAAELPRIQPFLTHPDPEIRTAALAGIVNLGHAAGAPVLRAAARQLVDSKEAVGLLQAADYLELTPAPKSMRPRVRAAGKPASPQPAPTPGTPASQDR